jgi:alkylation response protein AidB-like acyl-CoA dehydrogenase
MSTPGIEVRTFGTLGGGVLCEVFLDQVEIPGRYLVGELNGGWEVLMYTLDFERVTAEKIGGFQWVVDELEKRLQAVDRLEAHSSALISQLRGQLQAARLLSFRAADTLDRGQPASADSAMAKLAGSMLARAVGNAAVDLLGLEGLADGTADAAIQGRAAALYRASAGSGIAGGAADIQRLVIARRGLGLR